MAKIESTAVNALIDQVSTGKQQRASEPSADLFSAPKSTTVNPPRLTSPIPPMRGAGEVEPLPARRAPHSTAKQQTPPIRMSTADPARGNTIPPISRPSAPPTTRSSGPALPRPSNPRPSQPPHRTSAPTASRSVPSLPTLPPPTAPVAAPFEAKGDNPFASVPALPQQYPIIGRPHTVDATGDIVKADNWFDVSMAIHRVDEPAWNGSAVVQRPPRDVVALVKKLIAPTIVLVIVGVMVGGYFAFDGDGGKKKPTAAAAMNDDLHTVAAAPTDPTAPRTGSLTQAPAVDPPAVGAPAVGAPAVGAPEPPTKAEDLAKQTAAAAETAKQAAHAQPASESMIPAATAAAITRDAPAADKAKLEAKAAPTPAPKAAPTPAPKAAPTPAPKAAPTPAPAVATAPEPPKAEVPIAVKSLKTSSEPPQIREVQTPRGVVKLVDVRIDSHPAGATVMLVDTGKTSFLGSTPLATSLDPSKKYDLIFTIAGRPTQMAPLDPAKTSRLDVTLSRANSSRKSAATAPSGEAVVAKPEAKAETKSDAKAETKPDAKKAAIEVHQPGNKDEAKIDTKTDAKKVEAKPEVKKAEKAVAAAPGGEGTLMVSSKPPCELVIDGKPTGLSTPQKSIPLSAGVHKVTFVNEAQGIKKTVSVSIAADQSTKLLQDLMKK